MRVISGDFKGHSIHPPKQIKARPTTDRAKEALFNTLANSIDLSEANVLDLFAGTGNISYEFASRGAEKVTSVDISHHSIRFIKSSFESLNYTNFKAVKSAVLPFLKRCEEKFDVIFADPPYALDGIPEIARLVFEKELLNPGGILVIEHYKTLNISHKNFTERREYGQSVFSYFQN